MKPLNPLTLILVSLLISLTYSQDPCLDYESKNGLDYSAWMTNIANMPGSTFGDQRLSDILVGGTHDAGLSVVTKRNFLGSFLPHSAFVTQNESILGQLCTGSRWFDVRFKWSGGQWLIYHGSLLTGYGRTFDQVISDIEKYLAYPKYDQEIVQVRIKISGGVEEDFISEFRDHLQEHMIHTPNFDDLISSITLQQMWDQNKNLIVYAHKWKTDPTDDADNGRVFDYTDNFYGGFSDAGNFENMLTRCVEGQHAQLIEYKKVETEESMFGLWWTVTGGSDLDIKTDKVWEEAPNGLNDFYIEYDGEIGNAFIIDFWNDYDGIMELIVKYNENKFVKHVSPLDGFVRSDDDLPGVGMIDGSEECKSVGSEIDRIIMIFAIVGVISFVVFIALMVGIGCIVKKKCFSSAERV
eukprot:TRINITY_DN6262_c0_g1_i1.p1 TRINITY_DN6262_c0_g1~~TRINITY_DN6262_c0_g1_i1.p1  ORF type:complete len:426 (-),score=88.77 TRINITY_DN6262_c0_g1_i1:56-1285(-)